MTPQSLLPDNWILVTGLFYWLPGEVISSKIWKVTPPRFGRSWHLLLLTPFLLAVYSFLQSNSGLVHEGRLLLRLSLASVLGTLTYVVFSGERLLSQAKSLDKGLELYSCILFAYYIWFLTLLWWLPAGVKSIWIWPLQFEPRLITGLTAIMAMAITLISTIGKIQITIRLGLASLGCMLWQISGILGKSLTVDEIVFSDKITGYLRASRLFQSTSHIAQTFADQIGRMPFHVNTHPAGKVFLMKILDEIDSSNVASLWGILMVICVCLIVPLTFKISRLLLLGKSQSALIASSVGLIPSISLFCPGFDAYSAFLCTLLLLAWLNGLTKIEGKGSLVIWSCVIGSLGYSVVTFSYTSLVFGSVLIAWAPCILGRQLVYSPWSKVFNRLFTLALGSIGVLFSIEFSIYALTGYSNLVSLFKSMSIQSAIEASNRVGFNAFLLDFVDFAYGVSPIIFAIWFVIGIRYAVNCMRRWNQDKRIDMMLLSPPKSIESLIALTVASIVIIAISGFLDIETARVWLMLTVPVGICTTHWVVKTQEVRTFRSVLLCQAIWGTTLLLRYQFYF